MKKIMLITLILTAAYAQYYRWERYYLKKSEYIDTNYARCHYSNGFGSPVAVVIEGPAYSCPYAIDINTTTGHWKKAY